MSRVSVSARGRMSAARGVPCLLFCGVAVHMGGDSLDDPDLPISLIGDFGFYQLSLVVPALILVATIMLSMGREKGQASTSNAGGVLAVLAIFFIIEPLGRMTLQGDLDAQTATTASGRLAIIALLIHFSTKMMIDSLLLEWVRTATMNMDIDLFPNQQVSELESHADEAPPLG